MSVTCSGISTFFKRRHHWKAFYFSINDAELISVADAADVETLLVLECIGREQEVLHYLTHQPRLQGVKRAAMISTVSSEHGTLADVLRLLTGLRNAVQDSMGHSFLLDGAKGSSEMANGFACVRLLLVR